MYEQGFIVGIAHHLLNAELDVVPNGFEREGEIEFQYYLTDAEGLYTRNGGFVRAKYHCAFLILQGWSQTKTVGKFYARIVHNMVVSMS